MAQPHDLLVPAASPADINSRKEQSLSFRVSLSKPEPLLTPHLFLNSSSQASQVNTAGSAKRNITTGTKQPGTGLLHIWK